MSMQVRIRQDQIEPLKVLAARRSTTVPVETQVAVDSHLAAHRALLRKGPKIRKP